MAKCRAWACGCEAGGCDTCPVYCEMCKEFTPICPGCGAVYGEHRLDCTVADGYEDCGEGPWFTPEAAAEFARAEVGLPCWGTVCGNGMYYVVVKRDDD